MTEKDIEEIIDSNKGSLFGDIGKKKYIIKAIHSQHQKEMEEQETEIICEINATGVRDFKNGSCVNIIDKFKSQCADELEELMGIFKQQDGALDNLIKKWRGNNEQ